MVKAIQWNLLETEAVARLRGKLQKAKDMIQMVHLRAQEYAMHTLPSFFK